MVLLRCQKLKAAAIPASVDLASIQTLPIMVLDIEDILYCWTEKIWT